MVRPGPPTTTHSSEHGQARTSGRPGPGENARCLRSCTAGRRGRNVGEVSSAVGTVGRTRVRTYGEPNDSVTGDTAHVT